MLNEGYTIKEKKTTRRSQGGFKDLTGLRFNHLVALSRAENAKHGSTRWLCKCDCGNTCIVGVYDLKHIQKTCGCGHGQKINEYLKSRVKINENGCWIWQKGRFPNGYGQIKYQGYPKLAHILSYEIFVGKVTAGMCVCHKCNCKSCINPDHLYLATPKQNVSDARRDGLIRVGEETKKSKLTQDAVRIIRNPMNNKTIAELAKQFNVTKENISAVIKRKTWRWM